MRRRLPVLPAVVALALLGTSGCAAFSDDDGGSAADTAGGAGTSGTLAVATAFYPLQYVAERVAGDRAEVTNLTTPGTEPHDLEPTVRETAEINAADLVVFEGAFQPALEDAIDQATGAVLDVADVVDLHEAEHAEGEEHAHEEGEEHAEGEEHDHGGLDPHFWQDPVLLAEVGDAVAEQLTELDPDGAEDYRAGAADLRTDLEGLDTAYDEGLAGCERSTVVVSHDAFSYLDKYGLSFAPIAGLSPDAEPTPADLGRLQELIAADGITTVFGERLVSARLSETLASDMGITTAVLDPLEGLSSETEDQDYLSLMQANLEALRTANGCA